MKKRVTTGKSRTDWQRLRAMPEMFARAVVRRGLKPVARKAQLTLRLDQDVLDWFRKQGRGWQTQINSLLRACMEAHK
ncbi:MAG: BrnA antitoxin family protein [Blastocatellia bacterium]